MTHCANTHFQGEPRQRGREIHGGMENLGFSNEIAVYLGNGTSVRFRPMDC